MSSRYDLNVQCFAKRKAENIFTEKNDPRLLYVSRVRPNHNAHPRILHSHKDHIEVLLICDGQSDFLIHNRKYPLKSGDMVIYNSEIVHDDLTGPDTEISYYCVAIGELHLPDLRENALVRDDAGFVFPTGRHYEAMKMLCEMMFESLSREETGAETFCRSLMQALLIKALTVIDENQGRLEERMEDEDILGIRIKGYIDEHYMEPLNLQIIGDGLNVSPYYVSHVFKKMSGYSPIQYLLRRRLGEAQTLLISTDRSISEIAGMVGFETQNYFNAQFTKHVGIPPKKYRENYVVRTHTVGKRRECLNR
ncbi:MAG: helix-turn-helix transcriptional regulator [Blautia sp.]|nr:helix-turn-helix transcriptional regulator [Blautia sp.]